MFKRNKYDRYENVYMKDYDIHYSRIIASWANVGGKFDQEFKNWLRSIEDESGDRLFDEETIADIYNLATCGKMEWEENARRFLNK